jgi:hypothetical protein
MEIGCARDFTPAIAGLSIFSRFVFVPRLYRERNGLFSDSKKIDISFPEAYAVFSNGY